MASKRTVLVVEDEMMLLDLIAEALEEANFEVMKIGSGEDAVAVLDERQPIDLLLTDIRLPGTINGWDVAEHARAVRPDLPVIYATGYSDEEPRQVSDSDLVMKPYRLSSIVDMARKRSRGS